MSDTLIVFLIYFIDLFNQIIILKSRRKQKHEKIPSMRRAGQRANIDAQLSNGAMGLKLDYNSSPASQRCV